MSRFSLCFVSLLVCIGFANFVAAADSDFIVYAANRSDGTIYQIDSSGNKTVFVTGLGQPNEIVIDADGNLLVADPAIDPIDRIHQITPAGVITDYFIFDDGRDNPEGLALRSDGTLFVSGTMELNNAPPNNSAPNALVAISADGIAADFASVGPQENLSVAIKSDDVLFVTDIADNGSIWRVLPTGESSLLVNNLGATPWAIEVGLDGSLFVAMEGLGQILQVRLTDDLAVADIAVYVQISRPLSLAIDDYGRLFVGQFDRVSMIDIDRSILEIADGFNIVSGIAVASILSAPEQVNIDIKPGSDPNCFNANGHGVIPVAILGSDTFDVTLVDQTTLLFGGLEVRVRGNKGPLCHLEDSNVDGKLDLICQFEDNSDFWTPGDGDATLTGKLHDETEFEGTDSICVVP